MRYIFLLLLLIPFLLQSQYYEDFESYSDGTTVGNTWWLDCSNCSLETGDYFEIKTISGTKTVAARDLDGVAIFETDWIDLTSYYGSFILYGELIKVGDMEGPNTPTSSDHDWVHIEYAIDGGSWVPINDFRNRGLSDSTFYGEDGSPYDIGVDDEYWGVRYSTGNMEPFWVNNIIADSIKIRIRFYNTANTENWRLQQIAVWSEVLLPVELVSIVVNGYYGYNEIKWLTANETNNKGFKIQRSENAIDWVLLGWIEGNGTSNDLTTWVFNDFYFKGENYYRIIQIDYDGSEVYSNIVHISREIEYIELYNLNGQKVTEVTSEGIYLKYNPINNTSERVYIKP